MALLKTITTALTGKKPTTLEAYDAKIAEYVTQRDAANAEAATLRDRIEFLTGECRVDPSLDYTSEIESCKQRLTEAETRAKDTDVSLRAFTRHRDEAAANIAEAEQARFAKEHEAELELACRQFMTAIEGLGAAISTLEVKMPEALTALGTIRELERDCFSREPFPLVTAKPSLWDTVLAGIAANHARARGSTGTLQSLDEVIAAGDVVAHGQRVVDRARAACAARRKAA